MVRIRGLHRALGRVLGRVLGRHIASDEEEAPRRRRPIAFAHSQQPVIAVAEDVDHVDHVANGVHEQPQEPVTNHVDANTEGSPGEAHDTSV